MQSYYQDDLDNTSWLGEVVDIEDPDLIGRVKVKVYGKFDNLPADMIPWAYPSCNSTAGGSSGGGHHSVPKLNSIVGIRFNNGNIYHPEYYYLQRISDELKEEIKEDYEAAQSLLFDTEEILKLFYVRKRGIMLRLKEAVINILQENTNDTQKHNNSIHLITPGTVEINSKLETILRASEIFLGREQESIRKNKRGKKPSSKEIKGEKESIQKTSQNFEPLLYGELTADWLNDLCDILLDILRELSTHIHNAPFGPTTMPLPPEQIEFSVKDPLDVERLRARIIDLKSTKVFTK